MLPGARLLPPPVFTALTLLDQRVLIYEAAAVTGADGTVGSAYALVPSEDEDSAWWMGAAYTHGFVSTAAGKLVAVNKGVFTADQDAPVTATCLLRHLENAGALFKVSTAAPNFAAGVRRIDAESADRGAYTITSDVAAYTVAAVEVSPSSLGTSVGETTTFTATLTSGEGTTLTDRTPSWSSSDPAVVLIDAQGRAEALQSGAVTITATVDGVSGTADVSVG